MDIKARDILKFDKELLEKYQEINKAHYVTLIDEEYPTKLKYVNKPPFTLFYYGDINILNSSVILGVVGTRKNTESGEIAIKKVLNGLNTYSDKLAICSGMAKGIDSIAQRQAIRQNIKTISILGGGIDEIYPQINEDIYQHCKTKGLIISEYPNDNMPLKEHFPMRNRLIAGLSEALVIGEANPNSGTSITANYAIEFGKDVFCIPSDVSNPYQYGNNLIKDGAMLINCSQDLIDYLKKYF